MTPAEALAVEAREAGITPLEALLRRGRLRATLTMLGPAFVASIAYVDPGNFATNIAGGARFGYLLLWVVLAANLMAMLIQYLSAKLGIVTDSNLPESFRAHYPRWMSWGMWVQAEIISMSTDIAAVPRWLHSPPRTAVSWLRRIHSPPRGGSGADRRLWLAPAGWSRQLAMPASALSLLSFFGSLRTPQT